MSEQQIGVNPSVYKNKEDFFSKLNENYDQIREINSGGGGIIYSGIHRRLQQKVVLKKIRTNIVDIIGKDREMQILMNLKHTYLPRILDFWSYEDEVYTVMEFIEGKSFKELLDLGTWFSEKDVIRWTRQLAEVLHYLHTSPEHIIHSDIKPANIMLTPENNICLIDFNISVLKNGQADETIGYSAGYAPVEQLIQTELRKRDRIAPSVNASVSPVRSDPSDVSASDNRTQIGDIPIDEATRIDDGSTRIDLSPMQQPAAVQTAPPPPPSPVISPEAAAMIRRYGEKLPIDARTDIYSACATMYHLLSGRKPSSCSETVVPIETLVPSVNDAYAKVLMHGLSQDPSNRWQTAEKFLKALDQLSKSTKQYRRMRIRQDLSAVFVILLLAASSVCTFWGFRMKMSSRSDDIILQANQCYLEGDYDEALRKLKEDMLPFALSDAQRVSSYRIEGSCYLETEDYEEAAKAFFAALMLDETQPELYRDYGISLVRLGRIGEARNCLKSAELRSLSSDTGILLLSGEISAACGETEDAEQRFLSCLEASDVPMERVRSLLSLDALYAGSQPQTREAFDNRIKLLTEYRDSFLPPYRVPVWERLAQVYIDAGNALQDSRYTAEAVTVLDSLIIAGESTMTDEISRAICLQSMGNFSAAYQTLLDADQHYPENYLIWKRMAFLELDIQSSKDAQSRDYQSFDDDYLRCTELYEKIPHTEQDLEMDYLREIRSELTAAGWLAEE